MRRRRRERPKPMPTEEDKRRAQIKAAGADPLVWAMKSVDDKFPDEREKSVETIRAEAEVEMKMGSASDDAAEDDENNEDEIFDNETVDEDVLDDIDEDDDEIEVKEIHAEGKTVMPMKEGAMTVDVAPMRQNVDEVSKKGINRVEGRRAEFEKFEAEKAEKAEIKKVEVKKAEVKKSDNKKPQDRGAQVKLTALESKQKKMMFGLVALVIIALGGVVFGVVAMINQNKATLELANQIVTSGGHENLVDDEYIYLKDWNMKIKIVSGLTNISFDYDEDEYSSVLIWGVRKDTGANYTPDFAKQSKNGNAMGIVNRVPRYERAAAGRLIWYDDYYNYYYQGPTTEPEASESEMSWWVESYLLIKEMLTNADNYIKFDDSTISQQ
ncbi:hypothetical protein IJI18_01765 [Candidatus Saccharibacteria bacterium]|nr:hypothetical protein [Candidatus Saccharibacteria bacterium]